MDKMSFHFKRKITRVLLVAASVFLIVYLSGAIIDTTLRYQQALALSKMQAHTNLGKEGYEYIFEPNTQILVDKVLPNQAKIFTYILVSDYLRIDLVSGCTALDPDICEWIQFNVFYFHDPKPEILKLTVYATGAALVVGIAVFLVGQLYSSTTRKRHMYS